MDHSLNDSLLHVLHRAAQAANDQFSGHINISDLTARQFIVLRAIAANDGASQTTLADHTGIDRSTLADVTGRLHQRGLISRKRTRSDARVYAVRLTEAGVGALKSATPLAKQIDARLLENIPASKRAEFIEHLRLVAGVAAAPAQPKQKRLSRV